MGWKNNWLRRILSNEAVDALRSEPRLFFYRLLCFSPGNLLRIYRARRGNAIDLILGSGPSSTPGWVSIDLTPPKDGIRWDLRWPLPLRAGQVARLQCEHFLEHLSPDWDVQNFLSECRRILAKTGHMRLILPDAAIYLHAYARKDKEFFLKLNHLGGAVDELSPIEVVNMMFRMGGSHKFAYDLELLNAKLAQAGFGVVVRNGRNGSTGFPDLPDWWREVESVYLLAS
jgi:predicted SAM-dependent methyltransferase